MPSIAAGVLCTLSHQGLQEVPLLLLLLLLLLPYYSIIYGIFVIPNQLLLQQGVQVVRRKGEGGDGDGPGALGLEADSLSSLLDGSLGLSESLTGDSGLSELSSAYLRLSRRCAVLTELLVRYDKAEVAGKTSHERVLSSSVFLAILKEFIRSSDHKSLFDSTSSVGSENERIERDLEAERSVCGMVLLTFQEKISFDLLLKDGLHIFLLLETLIKSRADILLSIEEEGKNIASCTFAFDFGEGSPPGYGKEGSPLITEVTGVPPPPSPPRHNPRDSDAIETVDEAVGDVGTIGSALAMLSAIISFGVDKRIDAEEEVLRRLSEPLQVFKK